MKKKSVAKPVITETPIPVIDPILEKEIEELVTGKTKPTNDTVKHALEKYQEARIEFDRLGQAMQNLEQQYNELKRQRLIQQGNVNAKAESLEYWYLEARKKIETKENPSCQSKKPPKQNPS